MAQKGFSNTKEHISCIFVYKEPQRVLVPKDGIWEEQFYSCLRNHLPLSITKCGIQPGGVVFSLKLHWHGMYKERPELGTTHTNYGREGTRNLVKGTNRNFKLGSHLTYSNNLT